MARSAFLPWPAPLFHTLSTSCTQFFEVDQYCLHFVICVMVIDGRVTVGEDRRVRNSCMEECVSTHSYIIHKMEVIGSSSIVRP